MAFAKHTMSVQDLQGNLVSPVTIEVRRVAPGMPLEPLFSDRDGEDPLTNPIEDAVQDVDGVGFYCAGGIFQVTVSADDLGVSVRQDVPIGTAAGADIEAFMLAVNNLSELEDPEEAFNNIKQLAEAGVSGVVPFPTALANIFASNVVADGGGALSAGHLLTAAELVTLTDAATIAVNWATFINAQVTLTTNRILGNPTNGKPGQWRTILVKSDGGPDDLTFGNQYGGVVPTVEDMTTTQWYLLMIYCVTTTHFLVSVMDASPP